MNRFDAGMLVLDPHTSAGEAALFLAKTVKALGEGVPIEVFIARYDDDARELIDIPEVMRWMLQVCLVLEVGGALLHILRRMSFPGRMYWLLAANLIDREQLVPPERIRPA